MGAIYEVLFAWLPTQTMRIVVMGLFTIAVILIVLRLIKLVLDAIPFL